MKFSESFSIIDTFGNYKSSFSPEPNESILEELEKFRKIKFPPEFREYINSVAPNKSFYFDTVGNSIQVLPKTSLSWKMDGYNYNSITNTQIDDWNDNLFLFANEGGYPIVIDLSEDQFLSPVYSAMHGCGSWEFIKISDSIAQFLLLSSALHHALSAFGIQEYIIDDEKGFNLAKKPSKWLFPFMKQHAGPYYQNWVSVFDNS